MRAITTAATVLCAFIWGVVAGQYLASEPTPEPVPATIDLLFEDELCLDVVYDPATDSLTAEMWRGDPDTCEAIPS